jgi:hypothetical protein
MEEQKERERFFEVKRIGGTHKWIVVELWENGEIRGPFFSQEEALQRELSIAQENGWSTLQKV